MPWSWSPLVPLVTKKVWAAMIMKTHIFQFEGAVQFLPKNLPYIYKRIHLRVWCVGWHTADCVIPKSGLPPPFITTSSKPSIATPPNHQSKERVQFGFA